MAVEYTHIGIPITNKKPGMVYNEGANFWVSNVDDYDYKIEYLKFEEGHHSLKKFIVILMWLIEWMIFRNILMMRTA